MTIAEDLDSLGLDADGFAYHGLRFRGCLTFTDAKNFELTFVRCDQRAWRHKSIAHLPRGKSYCLLYSPEGELRKMWRFDK